MHDMETTEPTAKRAIVRVLDRDPQDSWTRERLAAHFGLSQSLVARILADLVRVGAVYRVPGPDDEYASTLAIA